MENENGSVINSVQGEESKNNSDIVFINFKCGKLYNKFDPDIEKAIYVDDSYLKNYICEWIKKNINIYKFRGRKCKAIKKSFMMYSPHLSNASEMIGTFFSNFANNPFFVQYGFAPDSKECICSSDLNAYFVLVKENCIMPIGCLFDFVHSKANSICITFCNNAAQEFTMYYEPINNKAAFFSEEIKKINKSDHASHVKGIAALATSFMAIYYIFEIFSKIDWKSIKTVFSGTENVMQAIGFLCEKGMNIDHNLFLSTAFVALSIFWLIYLVVSNIKPIKEMICFKRYYSLKRAVKYCAKNKKISEKIYDFLKRDFEFIKENEGNYRNTFFKPDFSYGKNSKYTDTIIKNINKTYSAEMKTILKKIPFVLLTFILMSATVWFYRYSNTDDFKARLIARIVAGEQKKYFSKIRLEDKYITNTDTPILSKPDDNSLIVYNLPVNTKCDMINDNNELYSKVEFMTEYGFLKGWVPKQNLYGYNPYYDDSLRRTIPMDCLASSVLESSKNHDYSAQNAADSSLLTSWQEGVDGSGVGEWIAYQFDNAYYIKSIGIYNGNGGSEELYNQNRRIIKATIEFSLNGGIVFSGDYDLRDNCMQMQYIHLNKSIYADLVRLIIADTAYGLEYDDTCLAEFEVYDVIPDDNGNVNQ